MQLTKEEFIKLLDERLDEKLNPIIDELAGLRKDVKGIMKGMGFGNLELIKKNNTPDLKEM
jgi:hypothetical protein